MRAEPLPLQALGNLDRARIHSRSGAQRHNQSPKKKWAIRPLVRSPNWGFLTHPDPGSPTGASFALWGGDHPSGLSRNQLQLLYNTPKTRRKQRFYAIKRSFLRMIKRPQIVCLLPVRASLRDPGLPRRCRGLIFFAHQANAVSPGMVRNIHGLRHIFKVDFRVAFDKSYPVNPELEDGREPRF